MLDVAVMSSKKDMAYSKDRIPREMEKCEQTISLS